MEGCLEVVKLILNYIGLGAMLAFCIALLFILLISFAFEIGYFYDTVFGDWPFRVGIFFSKKFPAIKKNKLLLQIYNWIKPRKTYLRYETPLCTYCFSFTAICFTYELFEKLDTLFAIFAAVMIYIVIYFVGMLRRYGEKDALTKVLNNNLEFLKLSFAPVAFLITIVGFVFTVTGVKVTDFDYDFFTPILKAITEFGIYGGILNQIYRIIIYSILLLVLLYIVSIPLQLISYFIILTIKYFMEYGESYKKLFGKYKEILRYVKIVFSNDSILILNNPTTITDSLENVEIQDLWI